MVAIEDGKTLSLSVGGGDAQVYCYEVGDPGGEPVVFLHTGGAGVSAFMCWRLNLDAAADAGYRVLAPDSPGFGRSAPGDGVATVLALLDAHGIDAAHLVGNSGGAMTATRFAGEHPQRVRSLTISGGEPRVDTPDTRAIVPALGATDRMNFARSMLNKPQLAFDDMRRATADFFSDAANPAIDATAQLRLDTLADAALLERVRADAMAQVARGRSATPDAVFAAITAPTFLLHGRDEPGFYAAEDAPLLMSAAMQVVNAVADCRLTVLPHCGHWPQLERPQLYNELLLGFLRSVTGGSRG